MTKWNTFGRKRPWPNGGTVPDLACGNRGKVQRKLIKITGIYLRLERSASRIRVEIDTVKRTCSITVFFFESEFKICSVVKKPVSVATRSKAWVCGPSPAEIVGSNPSGAWMFVCRECCVLSGRGLCDEPITRPEESYRLWCVVVCDLETSRMRRP